MKNLKNKVAVITGAGSGIGRSLALKLHKKGVKLALNDFNEGTLNQTIKLIGLKEEIYKEVFDVSDKDRFYQFANNCIKHYKKIDIVINNAGITNGNFSASETTIETYSKVLGVNLWGMIYGTLAFLPTLREQEESSVVNLSSIMGILGTPYQSVYSTSKFAIRGFSEAVAVEELCHKTGVTVTSVHPGGIKTNIVRNIEGSTLSEDQLKKLDAHFPTTADKAADKIIVAIQKKKTRVIIGPDAKFMYFLSRFSHKLSIKFLEKWAKKLRRANGNKNSFPNK
ncbi:MAG: SDR family NAD(P)-dependent oxidoreductase [Flavobacteriaceae bacterium]|nr:SDR family NAD(P)-dependent oxidoreductase [Flavobacteriaceae bacterium]